MSEQSNIRARAEYSGSLVVNARLRTDQAIIRMLPVTFYYDATEPFTIRFEFGDPDSGTCSWIIGREQLLEGLLQGFRSQTISIREVAVLAATGAPEPPVLRMTLRGVTASAVFEMKSSTVRAWLAGTFSVVEAGAEGDSVDWDGIVSHLTGDR